VTDDDTDIDIVEEPLSTEAPIVGPIEDLCRSDDKVRCGTTSVYICDVQKCDGVSNCPNGEDEEDCPSNEPEIQEPEDDQSGEGDLPEIKQDLPEIKQDLPESEYETSKEIEDGDFYFYHFQRPFEFFDFFSFLNICRYFVESFVLNIV
jgi:hypothetical protein